MMNYLKTLLYALVLGIVFLLAHLAVQQMNLSETSMFIAIMFLMLATQIAAIVVLAKNKSIEPVSFRSLFLITALTQLFSVLLITLHSVLYPQKGREDFKIMEVLISILIFAIVYPWLVSGVAWFFIFRKKK